MCTEITTMISGEKKTNRTRGTKLIAQYFSKITKETSITQEAKYTPLSVPHSDMLGVAEGVAFDVGQYGNREDVRKGAPAVNIISNSKNQPSNFQFPKTGLSKQSRSFIVQTSATHPEPFLSLVALNLKSRESKYPKTIKKMACSAQIPCT